MLIRPVNTLIFGLLVIGGILAWSYRGKPVDAYLPHRPMHEIDIQGHQPLYVVHGDLCPGRYTYGAYGVTITCWGVR